ncbi:extracellular solute-binding protein [Lacrimispora sp.]|uniref:extracellular solute-binding protein n=1 Tax=Lacrimispora sp. TaxID=2719234 RepID=UPI003460D919
MKQEKLKVLAVADPAVEGYLDKELGILDGYGKEVDFHMVPWADYYPMMMKAFAGEADYDIVMVAGHLWLCDFVEKGYLSEIDFEEEDILPVIAEEMKYKGKTYLSPSFCDGHMILYRKSLLSQTLGKEFGSVITPQEYIEAAKAYRKAAGGQATAMKAHKSEIFTDALPFLRMYGGDAYDSNGRAVCQKEEAVKGLQSYVELKAYAVDGTGDFGNGEIASAIREKRAAMAVTWSGQMGEVFKDGCLEPWDIGFSTFSTAWNVTWSFGICLNSGKKEAAQEFLKYLRSPDIDQKVGRKSGAPVRRASYEEGTEECPWFPVQFQMMGLARPLPHLSKAGEKNGILYEKISEAFSGRKTEKEAMEEAGKEIDRVI